MTFPSILMAFLGFYVLSNNISASMCFYTMSQYSFLTDLYVLHFERVYKNFLLLSCFFTFLKKKFVSKFFNRATILLPYRSYLHLKTCLTAPWEQKVEWSMTQLQCMIQMRYFDLYWYYWNDVSFTLFYLLMAFLVFYILLNNISASMRLYSGRKY